MKRTLLIAIAALISCQLAQAQDSLKLWTLSDCLQYALENNIQLQQTRNDYLSGVEDTKEAKSALLPSLSASTSQGVTNYPSSDVDDNTTYSSTYGLNASMTLYGGSKLRTAVKQQKLQNNIDALSVDESANDIRIAIVQAYMQVLYAAESVQVATNTEAVSKAQRDRADQMWKAGSISKVDFAQLESQHANDRYQVVAAQTSLDNYRLQLKQLLELDITEEMHLATPDILESEVLTTLPAKTEIYDTALGTMPEIKRGELSVELAELDVRRAKSGFYPTLALSASVGTGYQSGNSAAGSYGTQMWNRFNEYAGVTLSIPLFSNRKNRTAVNKAKIAVGNSQLTWQSLQKSLLKEVESAYLDAISAQSQYLAASEKERYAQQSFDLTSEQFSLGVKNIVELTTAQNDLTSAQQEVLQTKYIALMNIELLNIYQGRDARTIY